MNDPGRERFAGNGTGAALALESVTKTYRKSVVAVRDVSLEVAVGELVVLFGPSGGGKTTVLRLIAGLTEPSAGTIRIGGRVVNGLPPRERDVAMVFQDYALYPHLTVRGNLGFALRMKRTPRAEIRRRVDETAERLGLADVLDERPGALSGGEQQRAALGRALVRRPACILLDEPLSNLDAISRRRARAELAALRDALRTTAVYVTHDQEDAMTLGDRLVVLAGGTVLQDGAPGDVYRRPASRLVAALLGTPPMNFVEGRIEREGIAATFRGRAGVEAPLPADLREAALPRAGAAAVLGVRPEALRLSDVPANGGAQAAFTIAVSSVRAAGPATDVAGRLPGGAEIVARLPAGVAPPAAGGSVRLTAAPEDLHLFEAGEEGRRIDRERRDKGG